MEVGVSLLQNNGITTTTPWCEDVNTSVTPVCKSRAAYDADCNDVMSYVTEVGDDWPFYVGLGSTHIKYPFSLYEAIYKTIEAQPDAYGSATMSDTYMPSLACPDCDVYGGRYLAHPFNVTIAAQNPNKMFPGQEGVRTRFFTAPNQVLVGPLITQTRSKGGVCDSIPYNIESIREHYRTGRTGAGSKPECASSQTTKVPFGFDATFSPTSELYRQTNVLEMTTMYRFYNRSNNNERFYHPSWEDDTWPADFASAMAFWNDNVPGRANALEGIWSDEVSLDTLVPYGFFWDSGAGSGDVYGYPVFFDINLNVSKTTDMFQSLVDGQYLDPDLTSLVTTTLLLFNPELGLFALVQVSASPDPTGGTDLSSDMALFDPDFYDFGHNAGDVWRVALEVFFTIVLIYLLKEECVELLDRVRQGQAEGENVAKASLRYFTDPFNVLDLSSYIILAVAMFNWYQITNANIYFWAVVELRFNLYSHGEMGVGRLFELQKAPAEDAFELLDKAQRIVNLWSNYVLVTSIAVMMLCLQFMKNLDFHPKMGLVTKTFGAAAMDLIFFLMLFMIVHTIYSFVGCIM